MSEPKKTLVEGLKVEEGREPLGEYEHVHDYRCPAERGGKCECSGGVTIRRAAQHLKKEQGWLIERRDRPAVEWAFVTADKFISWTPRSLEALRFARKEEAEIFAECADFSEKVFVTEHIWMEPMRVQTDFHSVNLSTGEKTRSIVGDGECRHETVGHLKREQEGRCTCVVMTPRNIYPGGRHLDDSCPVHTIQPREQEPAPLYPRLCGLCPGNIESETDLEWHGLGNCVEICERCGGSGQDPEKETFTTPAENVELAAMSKRGVEWIQSAAQPPQELVSALRTISARDPQSPTCGPDAPENCENGCIGCIARAALTRGAVGGK